jgi:hypothetical protein
MTREQKQTLLSLGSRLVGETDDRYEIEVVPAIDGRPAVIIEVARADFATWLGRRMETRETHKDRPITGGGWARPRVRAQL